MSYSVPGIYYIEEHDLIPSSLAKHFIFCCPTKSAIGTMVLSYTLIATYRESTMKKDSFFS